MASLRLVRLIEAHEGRRSEPYKDSLGYWTIGVGHLIDARRGGSLDGIRSIPMSSTNVDEVLEADLDAAETALLRALPWARELDEVRKAVLIDMAFNLGIAGLLGFKNTLESVRTGQYHKAAGQMLQSKWAEQVKGRAVTLSKMMETGQWES